MLSADRWVRLTSFTVLMGFVGLNLFVGCNEPGWECRNGWPFTFYHWNDSIAEFNGSPAPVFFVTPLVADIVVGVVTAVGCGWLARQVTRR